MRAVIVRASSLVVALAALAACGPGNNPNNGPQKGGGVTIVSLSGMVAGMSLSTTIASGGFAENSSTSSVRCTQRTSGACTINECTTPGIDAGAEPQDAGTSNNGARSAGVITISGGGQMIQLMPREDNTYQSVNQRMEVFPAGTMLTVSAAGSATGVPAFTGTLTMPAQVAVTAPMLSLTAPTMIPRTQALVAAWTGGTTGKVNVVLSSSAGGNSSTISCAFDAAGGTGTVPADVMMALPAGSGSIAIAATDSRDQMAGDYKVTLSASSIGLIGAGGQAMFQ
jgi:hypothetical protein